MPQAGFEPTIPASKWPQTHPLDRAATGIGKGLPYKGKYDNWLLGFFVYDASAMDYYFTFNVPVAYISRPFPGDCVVFTSELSDSAYYYSISLHWKAVMN